jgi:hypothetical protein
MLRLGVWGLGKFFEETDLTDLTDLTDYELQARVLEVVAGVVWGSGFAGAADDG